MRRNKIVITLMILALMSVTNLAKAQESESQDLEQNNLEQSLDLDEFKKELQEVAQPSMMTNQISGRVRTLNTRYLISPGDSISLSVYGEPEFTQPQILVRPDGYATIEPFGEVYAAGYDVNELSGSLKERFKTYLLEPKISLKINSLHSPRVYIYGAVQKPGLYQQERITVRDEQVGSSSSIIPQLSIASVISNAGGIVYNADLRHVRVTNNESGRNETIDLMRLIADGDVTQDVYLRSGDSIYVPYLDTSAQISDKDFTLISSSTPMPTSFPVRVIGAVMRPGIQSVTSASPRLNSAIAASQGYTLDANRKLVTVQRLTPQGNVATFFVDPNKNDVILRPNDIVIVPDKRTSVASRGFDFLNNVVAPFGRFSDAYNSWAEMFNPTRRYDRW
ncbi:MAG: polysaccharide biosynthesis/export family protein [Desulfobacterales bacterium]|nr:polysaccharide biosynthesis/export family protein [Desulfobacterales bacterium]